MGFNFHKYLLNTTCFNTLKVMTAPYYINYSKSLTVCNCMYFFIILCVLNTCNKHCTTTKLNNVFNWLSIKRF